MEAVLHNLAPSVGELNGDRSNHPYGIVEDEPREYGACDFEVGGSPILTVAVNVFFDLSGGDLKADRTKRHRKMVSASSML